MPAIRTRTADSDDESAKKMDLNLTPMIDCIFQLLIFFMCATKFKTLESKIDAYLPEEHGTPTKAPDTPPPPEVNLILRKNPSNDIPDIYVDQRKVRDIPQLRSVLKQLAGVSKEVPIVIDPAPDVSFKWVILALDACATAGFKDTSFAQPPKEVIEEIK